MEIDATSDSASSPSLTELTVQQKSALAIPERTEEDEQRLFRLYQGWTFSERDGQVCQWVYQFSYDIQETQKNLKPKSYTVKGLQNAEIHLYENHNGIVDLIDKK